MGLTPYIYYISTLIAHCINANRMGFKRPLVRLQSLGPKEAISESPLIFC